MKQFISLSVALLLLLGCCNVALSADLEGFDEPAVPDSAPSAKSQQADADVFLSDVAPGSIPGQQSAVAGDNAGKPKGGFDLSGIGEKIFNARWSGSRSGKVENLYIEAVAGAVLVVYLLTALIGRRTNRRLGDAWAAEFAVPGGIFDRNFSLLGPGDSSEIMIKESANVCKFYASGRRHCQGLLATLTMKARQDALSVLFNLINPVEDVITVEVYMTEASMPPIVLAVATPKIARAWQRDLKEVERYAKKISVGKDMPLWSSDKLHVLSEHSSIFHDLFSDPKIQQMFNFSGPNAQALKYFRFMLFTSENSEGSYKHVLRFGFALPKPEQMSTIARLMEMVPLFIDVVGSYKLPVDLKKKAIDARTKAAEADEEARRKRLEAVQRKKEQKALDERAKLARMTPEARQKYEDKVREKQMKKQMRSRIKVM
mmetsp:Transcript_16388/g.35447  ORF Transcript_16388/g.35447 Transcript_16388/m.35447 type:complete len:430 (-) Transcript_16388:945-2234(-)|eukprot:CAMPEP_0202902548 /NCGR_PEP_ID=MMETSP1392-20130828/16917_1 /ASSEMBLY_ACC=CAM_ASM_000868 /TAXON_ID=225041 /ORGANISM="Chlamydomonas chlamydogama, Strain SAG 11-48b" /LENGTH=429 /DNA_ID=CAMNT_0049589327 /DNA_START=159 /DNA_END=1448 /DNA_ORIENTATION=+